MENKLVISPSPHIHSGDSVSKNMYGVMIALIPAYLVSLLFFGLGAFIVSLTSVIACVGFEYLIQKYVLNIKPSISDGSAVLTGLLLAFNLPSNLPFWMIIIGALVSIGIGKMSFGGLGNNIFNPALVGRVFLLISFPVAMTSWPEPGQLTIYLDAVTAATPLTILKEGGHSLPEMQDILIGYKGGSIGEVSVIALLIGFVYLLYKKIITWHIPVTIFVTVALFTGILYGVDPVKYASPMIHLTTGGLILGAVFMATDYVTSPMSKGGMIVYGVGIGIITILIRAFGAYPGGVSFAILIMNAFTPLINMYIKPKRFGEEKK